MFEHSANNLYQTCENLFAKELQMAGRLRLFSRLVLWYNVSAPGGPKRPRLFETSAPALRRQGRPQCGAKACKQPRKPGFGPHGGAFYGTGKNAVRNVPQNDRKGGKDSEAYLLECKWLSRRAEQGF